MSCEEILTDYAAALKGRICRKASPVLKASRLVEQSAVLRDTKHFVKDYQGNSLASGSTTAASGFA